MRASSTAVHSVWVIFARFSRLVAGGRPRCASVRILSLRPPLPTTHCPLWLRPRAALGLVFSLQDKRTAIRTEQTKGGEVRGVVRVDEAELRGHVRERVRESVEQTLRAMLEAEADAQGGAKRDERSPQRLVTRVGHYERTRRQTRHDRCNQTWFPGESGLPSHSGTQCAQLDEHYLSFRRNPRCGAGSVDAEAFPRWRGLPGRQPPS